MTTPHDNPPPRVSIGMPVYNGEPYLSAALDSLLGQTFGDFELIISDNGSTDDTEAICRAYAARDPRIRYERQAENRGLTWNCNRVCELARGELFKWAAADDLHSPTFLARCVAVLDADPGIVSCHGRGDYIDSKGNRLHGCDPVGDAKLGTSRSAHRRFRDVLLHHGWGARMFALTRRAPLIETGLLKPYYGWDKVMMAELAFAGRFHVVQETLFLERDQPPVESERQDTETGSGGRRSRSTQPATVDREGRPFRRTQFVKGYVAAAWRRAPDFRERMWCMVWVAAYVLQVRKWGRLTAAAVSRTCRRCTVRRSAPQTAAGPIAGAGEGAG